MGQMGLKMVEKNVSLEKLRKVENVVNLVFEISSTIVYYITV